MAKCKYILAKAIREHDLRVIDTCVESLRLHEGMTYRQIFEIAKEMVPELTDDEWESMMYKLDEAMAIGRL